MKKAPEKIINKHQWQTQQSVLTLHEGSHKEQTQLT